MATESPVPALAQPRSGSEQLASEWRRLTRVATVVAVLTAPLAFEWLHQVRGWSVGWSLAGTFFEVIAFRGLVDLILRRFIPWPSLFGAEAAIQSEDVVARRRVWFWRFWYRFAVWLVVLGVFVWLLGRLLGMAFGSDWLSSSLGPSPGTQVLYLVFQMPLLFLANFAIFFGPFLLMAASQIRSYEPGDADWGVKLEDVRGQAEAKEEVRRVVTLWQSGEAFERAGGKRERGLLMLGAPGTGKTMLSKAIATGFNCPFVSIPGSGFAGMFLGMDAITVRLLARRAKKLAAKWGGQCIVFIDEIDAVGQRRSSLGTGGFMTTAGTVAIEELCFFGNNGALTPTGDLILETRAWRERLFTERRAVTGEGRSAVGGIVNRIFPGGGMFGGGQLALNQLLVVMDGIGDPPFMRKTLTNRVNTFLDATYVVPSGSARSRCGCASRARRATRSTSSERATPHSSRSTRRSCGPAEWVGTCGSERRRKTTARTSSTSISERSPTRTISTRRSAATSSRGSRTGIRRRWSSRCARWHSRSRTTRDEWRSGGATSSRR